VSGRKDYNVTAAEVEREINRNNKRVRKNQMFKTKKKKGVVI